MRNVEPDIRSVIAPLYVQMRKTGVSPVDAYRLAITLVMDDLWRIYAVQSLDFMIAERLMLIEKLISSMRMLHFLNIAAPCAMLIFWICVGYLLWMH